MNFASDNWPGATPAVMAALARHNDGFATAYGGDAVTAAVTRRFCEVFGREVEVFFTATGTASNSISMATLAEPGGVIFCSEDAHVRNDEYGASELQAPGLKLVGLPERRGIIATASLEAMLARFPEGGRAGRPVGLSLTQASEAGALYQPTEIAGLAGIAQARGMAVHMDGARFANAVAALGVTPAAITWKAGVDIMSFGGTKNGCWAAEAIIVFSPGRWPDLAVRRARAGHTFSKARFVAAQFEGYLEAGNWLKTAAHANAMAKRAAEGITASQSARLGWAVEANEVFVVLPKVAIGRLKAEGAMFHPWSAPDVAVGPDEELVRLVTSFATTADEVDRFLGLL